MNRILLIITCAFLFGGMSYAQQGDGGMPNRFENKSMIDARVFSTPDIAALRAEDEINDVAKTGPWRFGENHFTDFNFNNSGTWSDLPDGGKIWRLKLICQEALTVNLTFEDLIIPEGNELFVYNEEKTFILGKFTENHIYKGQLGTELVPGNTVITEYYVAPNNISAARDLTISTVTHGYRTAGEFQEKAFGASGDCNMNSICPEGCPWDNQIRAAVMLVSGSNGFCSGSMINNTLNDGTPYVLTANHCSNSGGGPANWIFRFNWAAPTCTYTGTSPSFNSLSGAVLRAKRTPSDFCLVEITGGLMGGTVPNSFNTYFPGWDNSDTPPTSAVCVHHPSGDIKKLAFDDDPLISANGMMSSEANSQWQLQWDQNTTTEGGSSGSPLFDQAGRIVGQLWGGGASCFNQTSPDFYGKISYSWEPTGSNSTNQLKFWLDPNNDGNIVMDGYDPTNNCLSAYNSSTNEELCYGDNNGSITVTFTSGNSVGATFDIGSGPQTSGIFNNLTNGAYYVTVVDGDACTSTFCVLLSGPAQLTTSGVISEETSPFNGAVNLNTSGGTAGYTYAWTGPNGFTASTEDISGLESGVYSVLVTDTNGCTISENYTVNSVISVDELETISFSLFPNPSTGEFNVQLLNKIEGAYSVKVVDLSGRVIYAKEMNNAGEFTVDLSNSADGTYMMQIAKDNLRVTKRIVLKK